MSGVRAGPHESGSAVQGPASGRGTEDSGKLDSDANYTPNTAVMHTHPNEPSRARPDRNAAFSTMFRILAQQEPIVFCIAGKPSHSKAATSAAAATAADSDDEWDTGKGKGGKGKRSKGGAKGKRGGGGGGGGGGKAGSASNGVSQPGGGGQKLLTVEALQQKLIEWCPDLEEGPPELVRISSRTERFWPLCCSSLVCWCPHSRHLHGIKD